MGKKTIIAFSFGILSLVLWIWKKKTNNVCSIKATLTITKIEIVFFFVVEFLFRSQ